MDLKLDGKSAVVSGASGGIGRAIALGLAREGAKVLAVARRLDLLETLAEEAKSLGYAEIVPFEQDILAPDAPAILADAAKKSLGGVGILINNAGGSRPMTIESPDSEWDTAHNLNFTCHRRITHALLPQMIEKNWGRIISITGRSEPDVINAALAAKAGLHHWSKGISNMFGKHGVTSNCIDPGRTLTEQMRRNWTEEQRKTFAEKEVPVGHYGEPEDVAEVAIFLSSPLARYVTGVVLRVDGGVHRFQEG